MFKHSVVSLTLLSHPGHTVSNSLHILTLQRILFQTVSFANDCFIINNVDLLDNAEIQPLFGVHDPWQHIALLVNWHCGTLCMKHDRNNTSTASFHTIWEMSWLPWQTKLKTKNNQQAFFNFNLRQLYMHTKYNTLYPNPALHFFPNLLISAWWLVAGTGSSSSTAQCSPALCTQQTRSYVKCVTCSQVEPSWAGFINPLVHCTLHTSFTRFRSLIGEPEIMETHAL